MDLFFVSGNRHKFEEISKILKKNSIHLKWKKMFLFEKKGLSLKETAKAKAREAFNAIGKPLIVEDTGVFFEAFNNFPGAQAKRFFEELGFEGLLKKLEGKPREARFETIICFTRNGKKFHFFKGVLCGKIDSRVHNPQKDVLPYEKIFIPNGFNCTLSHLARSKKNEFSHRAIAAAKLVAFLKKASQK